MYADAFAVFEDNAIGTQQRIKIACVDPHTNAIVGNVYANTHADQILDLRLIIARTPYMLQRMRCGTSHLHVWRLPWTVYYAPAGAWIPLLDTTDNTRVPGEFFYTPSADPPPFRRERKEKQFTIRSSIYYNLGLADVPPTEYYVPAPSAPPAPTAAPPSRVPPFVASIMKNSAIANKEKCPITMEVFTDKMSISITSCFHLFETECVNKWLEKNTVCPFCRENLHSCEVVK